MFYATSFYLMSIVTFISDCFEMSSTEDDNAVLCRSREIALTENEAEVESVVESVVQGEGQVVAVVEDENGEVVSGVADESRMRGFGEKNDSADDPGVEVGSCDETASFHSATSDDRHDIDYTASKKVKFSRN